MTYTTEELRNQAVAQCNVVVHFATAIARTYADYGQIMASGAIDSLIQRSARDTAGLMNELCDILSSRDAVDDEDTWTYAVFDKAREMFPPADPPSTQPETQEAGK